MTLGLYSQHLIFFLTYEWPQYASVTSQWARRLARDKYAVLLGHSLLTKKIKCCEYGPWIPYSQHVILIVA